MTSKQIFLKEFKKVCISHGFVIRFNHEDDKLVADKKEYYNNEKDFESDLDDGIEEMDEV